ncbi:PQQ-binding-like beta-propeller repeat protein [candidate division KSB1 bacterium]
MRKKSITIFLAILLLSGINSAWGQSNWAQFRGPNGLGISSETKELPVEFGESKNMIWKTAVQPGNSSPCVWGDRIFLTGFTDNIMITYCISANDGKIVWQKSVTGNRTQRLHPNNTPATPTPVTDGERIIVYFGPYGLICYDYEGNMVWERRLEEPQMLYGPSASPILAGDRLIFINDSNKDSYVEAIDPKSGNTIWKTMRKESFSGSWSSPMHYNNSGIDEIVIYGIWWMKAYDLKDGSERWSVPGLTDEPCITPVYGDGLIFTTSYNMKTNPEVIGLPEFDELLEEYDKDSDRELTREEVAPNKSILSRYDADGEGDHPLGGFFNFLDVDRSGKITVKEWAKMISFLNSFKQENALMAIKVGPDKNVEPEIVWKHNYGVPECPSPLYYDGRIYMVKNGGIVSCLVAKTGELVYQDKLRSRGPFYSSPVIGDGKIYVVSARGTVTVFEPGDNLNILVNNELNERTMATPAIIGGRIYIRTEKNIFAFGIK